MTRDYDNISKDIRTLPIKDIFIDQSLQIRTGMNQETVNDYAEAMRAGAAFPPIDLFEDNEGRLWVGDGLHRIAGKSAAGFTEIDAKVRQGTRRDALLYAAGANAKHGLPRRREDKRKAVETLLRDREWSSWSDREIARATATSHTFVAHLRQALRSDTGNVAGMESSPGSTVVFHHGKTGKETLMHLPCRVGDTTEPAYPNWLGEGRSVAERAESIERWPDLLIAPAIYQLATGMTPEAVAAHWGVETERIERIRCPAPPERPQTLAGWSAVRDSYLAFILAEAHDTAQQIAASRGHNDLAGRFAQIAQQHRGTRAACDEESEALDRARQGRELVGWKELPPEMSPIHDALAALAWPWGVTCLAFTLDRPRQGTGRAHRCGVPAGEDSRVATLPKGVSRRR